MNCKVTNKQMISRWEIKKMEEKSIFWDKWRGEERGGSLDCEKEEES